jgi:hypothetical protein
MDRRRLWILFRLGLRIQVKVRTHQDHQNFVSLLLGKGGSGNGNPVLQPVFRPVLMYVLTELQKKSDGLFPAVTQSFEVHGDEFFCEFPLHRHMVHTLDGFVRGLDVYPRSHFAAKV